jgi:predicted RNA-binding Zn ribbon-like protein
MKKQQQAPGELERVRAFVNTRDLDTGVDELAAPDELRDWLAAHGLAPADVRATRADLRRAIAMREAIRAMLLAHTEGTPAPEQACQTLDEAARRARLGLRFDQHGCAPLQPGAAGVDGALGRLLPIVHGAIAVGTWSRLKACLDHSCEWAFYDHTKNRSGTWCTMELCGNRAKARTYRMRRGSSAAR